MFGFGIATYGLSSNFNMVFNRRRSVPGHLCSDYCIFGLSMSGLSKFDCIRKRNKHGTLIIYV